MGQARRAILWAAGGGLLAAAVIAGLFEQDPSRARGISVPWHVGLAGQTVLALLLLAALIAAIPGRRIRTAATMGVAGSFLSAAVLLAVCPAFIEAAWSVPSLRPFLHWLGQGSPDWGYDAIRCLSWEDRGWVARTWAGRQAVWSGDGRLVEQHGPGHVPTRESEALPARPLPVEALKGGTPLRVFETPGRYVETWSRGRSKTSWSPHWGIRRGQTSPRTLWSADDGHRILSLPDVSALALSADGRFLFASVPVEFPVPFPGLPQPAVLQLQGSRHLAFVMDLDARRVVWRRMMSPIRSAGFSPRGNYVTTGELLLDARDGRILGTTGGHVRAWLAEESFLAVSSSPGTQTRILSVPGLEEAGRHSSEIRRFSPGHDGRFVATWEGLEVRVFTFPQLEFIHSLNLLTAPRLLDIAGTAGAVAAILFGLFGLFGGAAAPQPSEGGSRVGTKGFLIVYFALLPVATAAAARLPIDLGDGPAAAAFVATGGLAFAMAWRMAGTFKIRLGFSLLAVALPGAALWRCLDVASTRLALVNLNSPTLVDDHWIVDMNQRKVVEISSGKEVARLGVEMWTSPTFEIEGSVLRARTSQCVLEWSTANWELLRAERSGTVRWGSLMALGATRSDGSPLPIEPSWQLDRIRNWSARELPDGRMLYLTEIEYRKWICASTLPRLRYLEIPMHAALGALAFLAAGAVLSRGRGCPDASRSSASSARG